ncbi:MAG: hypothetical protein LKI24_11050 [Acidipropionibacterium sp.]|jgi:hypothetical protein|nr:hypothetical protein [Acidipropionibacterium sp.]
MPSRTRHRFPICPATGLVRFGELKDARLALKEAARSRAAAKSDGTHSRRSEVRAFHCKSCRGYHLTKQRARSESRGVMMLG